MAGRLEGKIATVTGGASGIGRATSLAFAREGAQVVIADVDADGGGETVEMITRAGGGATFVQCDVTQAADVEAMVAHAVSTYGRLDCAFNNAGVEGANAQLADCPEDDWDRTLTINLKGVWLCLKYAVQQMLKQGGGGAIVNTSSISGLSGAAGAGAYGVSKAGVAHLTKIAAQQYASQGIRVNAVCPGGIHTPMTARVGNDPQLLEVMEKMHPLGRMGEADEVAEAVLWLCSDSTSFVTGHLLAVDGGFLA
ncbi:MAG: SDR family oxidoreductase [Chloroflexi bacterium]|nr:SDR family oxidoreductase [Chloroflexota bacterium]